LTKKKKKKFLKKKKKKRGPETHSNLSEFPLSKIKFDFCKIKLDHKDNSSKFMAAEPNPNSTTQVDHKNPTPNS